MEEKAPLAHGDEQVWPITAAPFIVLLGFDRSSSGISKRQIELFALGIPDSDSETLSISLRDRLSTDRLSTTTSIIEAKAQSSCGYGSSPTNILCSTWLIRLLFQ